MLEERKKKNPDYESSAVKLVNSPQIRDFLVIIRETESTLIAQRAIAEACIPIEVKTRIAELEQAVNTQREGMKKLIDEFGSYQDIENGYYAVKQMRKTVAYEPKLVRDNLDEKLAGMVIIEAVDKTKLAGLVKGGFITQEQADQCGIAKISYAYIIQ